MIFYSTINSNKTDILIEKYFELVNSGVDPGEILVLVQNGRKKKKFVEKLKNKAPLGNMGNINVFSFFALARSFLERNFVTAENMIKDPHAPVFAHLCGLEVSQYIFKNCIKEIEFKGYNSKVNLLHQLLRRYSLIVQNALCDDEVKIREKILKEAYAKEADDAIKLYKLKTLQYRAFDYLRQVNIFEYLYKHTKNQYRYVILDDADEITPAVFEYLKYIKKDVKEFFISQDPHGSSRLGYLSAAIVDFEKFLGQKPIDLRGNNKKTKRALEIFNAVKNNKTLSDENIIVSSFIRRDEMIFDTVEKIKKLIDNGTKPSQIAIVTPIIDDYLRFCFKKIKQEVFFLSGSEKLNQNPLVGAVIEILKLANVNDAFLSPFVLKSLTLEILKLPPDEAIELTQKYREANYSQKKFIKEFLFEYEDNRVKDFLCSLEALKNEPLSVQLFEICTKYIEKTPQNQNSILKLNKLAKQINDFEEVFTSHFEKLQLIEQLENTIISENPLSEDEIPENSIIVASAQKLTDSEINVKHLFLLDCSSSEQIKQDIGMLYNSWVFQKNWSKSVFEPDDNIELTQDRTARILYKLALCADEKIYVNSSIYDTLGIENYGGIDKYFKCAKNTNSAPPKKIIPRDDQKAVLEYKSGKMAVSAVAGSGKTTIMLALILKLLEGSIIKDIKSENIFVLTFMESAARNFRERIKQNYPDMIELPQISTIHGLALKILKENNNYTFLNLDNDFEITDENKRREIIASAVVNAGLEYDKTELYERAISDFKNSSGTTDIKKVKSPSFKRIFSTYDKFMKENNLLDYDDLLIYALKLLKTNQGVRLHYQNLARIIIEDEAQDSSPKQQELISILGEKHGNIIRCGDVNQAITATFSNSDVKGFKKFIRENKNVEMNKSQRCGVKIIDFANKTIDNAFSFAPEAFLNIKMQPVEGKNPTNADGVELKLFEKQFEEKKFIADTIRKIKAQYGEKSIGILLRSNWQIAQWANFFEEENIKVEKNIDTLNNNAVFRTVLAIFNFINDTKNIKNIKNSLATLLEMPRYKGEKEILDEVEQNDFTSDKFSKYSLWWDLRYFLFKSTASPLELIFEIGDYYFKNTLEFANVSMVYSIVEKIYQTQKTFEDTLFRMNEISNRLNKSAKFFLEEDKTANAVRIMTLHKAKGDEFDFVFIPELTCENMGLKIEDIKLKKNTEFIENLKADPKDTQTLKQEILEENYRLLYVGITRAKTKLYLSCSKTYKIFKKEKTYKPCEIFTAEGENEYI